MLPYGFGDLLGRVAHRTFLSVAGTFDAVPSGERPPALHPLDQACPRREGSRDRDQQW